MGFSDKKGKWKREGDVKSLIEEDNMTVHRCCCCLPMYHYWRNRFTLGIEAPLFSKVHAALEC